MGYETFYLEMSDDHNMFVHRWTPTEEIKAVVQIAHGMAEHGGRYNEFAEFLNNHGFAVYANDHRGHGRSVKNKQDVGFFAEEKGWSLIVDDMHELTRTIRNDYSDVPIFLFGHSMGSFLSRCYIQEYGDQLKGVILSGTSGGLGLLAPVAMRLVHYETKKYGKRGQSVLLQKLGTGSYNKKFQPIRTNSDWLSRDESAVDDFINDPLCVSDITIGFYHDMFQGMRQMASKKGLEKIPETLPIYLFSGSEDPVGNFQKGVKKAYRQYRKRGIKDITLKFYEKGRHEMLKEINKDEVFHDVLTWLDQHLVI